MMTTIIPTANSEKTATANTAVKQQIPKHKTKSRTIQYKPPGKLVSKAQLTLNTYDAQRLFLGRHESQGIGLIAFGHQMTIIWNAAAKDDPYADWILLRVYDAIKKCRNQLTALLKKYEKQLNDANTQANLTLTPFKSSKPLVQELWFKNPYGYLGASIIADYDKLIRIALTAYRIGVLLNQSHDAIREEWTQKINKIFKMAFLWKSFNITRVDVKEKADNAKRAENKLGKLPEAILEKNLRSPFSPYINNIKT